LPQVIQAAVARDAADPIAEFLGILKSREADVSLGKRFLRKVFSDVEVMGDAHNHAEHHVHVLPNQFIKGGLIASQATLDQGLRIQRIMVSFSRQSNSSSRKTKGF
jgi:hypothetical protein